MIQISDPNNVFIILKVNKQIGYAVFLVVDKFRLHPVKKANILKVLAEVKNVLTEKVSSACLRDVLLLRL